MLTIYITLLLSVGLNSASANISAHSIHQIQHHLDSVDKEIDTAYHLWYIGKLIEANNELAGILTSGLGDEVSVPEGHPFRCILQHGALPYETGAYLQQAYICTGEVTLLIAALYEADDLLRAELSNKYSEELNAIRNESNVNKALVNKALGIDYILHHVLEIRPFSLPDYYTFSKLDTAPLEILIPMVERWERELLQTAGVRRPSDALKLKTVVTAFHAFAGDYARVHRLSSLLSDIGALSDILPTQVMLKRFAFAATVGGYFQTALNLYRTRLLPLSRSITDEEEYLKVTVDYANILFRLGNVHAALETYQQVYNHVWQIQDPRYNAALLNNLAVSYLNAGFFDEYISLQIRSYEQAVAGGSVQAQLRALTNLYIYHWRNQDWVNAIRYLDEALLLAQEQGFEREIAEIYILFSTYYSNFIRDYERALFYVDAALEVIDPDQGFSMLVSAYIEKTTVLMNLERFSEAIAVNQEMLSQVVQRDDPRSEFDLNTQLVNLLLANGQIDEAAHIVETLQQVPTAYLNLQQRSLLTNAMVLYARATDSADMQLDKLRSTVSEIIRAVRLSGDLQSGFIRLESGYELSFSLLIDGLMDSGKTEEAIIWLDEIKNLNKAAFVNSSLLKSSILSEEEFLYDVQLTNRIDRIRSEILRASDDRLIELNTELLQLLNEKNQFNNRILNEYDTDELNLSTLRRQLRSGEQVISYQAIDSVMYIISITRGNTQLERKIIGAALDETARSVVEGLRNTTTNLHELHLVYEELVEPYLDDKTRRLFIVPDGFMYQIPLEILPRNRTELPFQFGMAHYLVEDMAISYQNSLTDLHNLKNRSRQNDFSTEYLGVGISEFDFIEGAQVFRDSRFSLGNLPYARTEIEESYQKLSDWGQRIKLLDSEGTVSNVLEHLTNSRVVHVASHSLVYDTDPLFSVIQLFGSPETEHNGRLHAYELFSHDIRSELVVLSSCDSGAGTFISGSGIIGLGRSLKYAGAQSLVLNLWSIRDQAAANLMVDFYSNLGKTGNKDEALRLAKLNYINTSNSDPAVWGSLIVFGDPGPLYNPFPLGSTIFFALLFLVAVALLRYYRR